MSERKDTLRQYVSDVLAVERAILEEVRRQGEDRHLEQHSQVGMLVDKIEMASKMHIRGLQARLDKLGGERMSPVKQGVTGMLGMVAGVMDQMRTDSVSKMLRNDYTTLSLAAIGYTMLTTTGYALMDPEIADMAATYLGDITPIITEISEVVPQVVVYELRDETEALDPQAANQALANSQKAWDSQHVHNGHVHDWEQMPQAGIAGIGESQPIHPVDDIGGAHDVGLSDSGLTDLDSTHVSRDDEDTGSDPGELPVM